MEQSGLLNKGANMPPNGRGRNCTAVMKATYRDGCWHLPQGVFGLIGQGLSAQQLPDGLRGGQQVDQGQEGLEKRERRDMREPSSTGSKSGFNCIMEQSVMIASEWMFIEPYDFKFLVWLIVVLHIES